MDIWCVHSNTTDSTGLPHSLRPVQLLPRLLYFRISVCGEQRLKWIQFLTQCRGRWNKKSDLSKLNTSNDKPALPKYSTWDSAASFTLKLSPDQHSIQSSQPYDDDCNMRKIEMEMSHTTSEAVYVNEGALDIDTEVVYVNEGALDIDTEVVYVNEGALDIDTEAVYVNEGALDIDTEVVYVNEGALDIDTEVVYVNEGALDIDTEAVYVNEGALDIDTEVVYVNEGALDIDTEVVYVNEGALDIDTEVVYVNEGALDI